MQVPLLQKMAFSAVYTLRSFKKTVVYIYILWFFNINRSVCARLHCIDYNYFRNRSV